MRLFIAVDLSKEQKKELGLLQQRSREYLPGVKWAAPEGMHLTLKFLGEVDESVLPAIKAALAESAQGMNPFFFLPGGVGVFPDPRRARVVWAGITEGAEEFAAAASSLEDPLAALGFAKEKRPFTPHLTVGRLRYPLEEALIRRFLSHEAAFKGSREKAAGLVLYESRLDRQGAVYTALDKRQFPAAAGK